MSELSVFVRSDSVPELVLRDLCELVPLEALFFVRESLDVFTRLKGALSHDPGKLIVSDFWLFVHRIATGATATVNEGEDLHCCHGVGCW